MSGVRGEKKFPGEFRRIQVQIGSHGKYIPPPPAELSKLLGNLERYINDPGEIYDPLVNCFLVHYQFEAIHPFADGNGRIGRVLLALMIYKSLGHALPWLYLSEFFERYRREYTDAMYRISTHGDWESWVELCLNGVLTQSQETVARCTQIRSLRDEYHERIQNSATPRSHTIIDWLFETPVLTTQAVADKLEVSFNTARRDLQRLVEVQILREDDQTRPLVFYADELVRVAYETEEGFG